MEECFINGFGNRYILFPDGKVWSVKSDRYLSQYQNNDGYLMVKLTLHGAAEHYSVHRLLAEHFIPNPQNLETVNHKDKNRQNNRLDNLEWMSRVNNVKHGLQQRYKVTAPSGEDLHITGMAEFCKNNNLTQANMSKVLAGLRPHHKGWTIKHAG